jgi:hypothetical protein
MGARTERVAAAEPRARRASPPPRKTRAAATAEPEPKSKGPKGPKSKRTEAPLDPAPAAPELNGIGKVDGLAPSTDPSAPDFAWWPIDRVKPWVQNPRKNARAVGKVADSIRAFGWGRPLIVNVWPSCAGELIVGHTAWLAAHELALDVVPVRIRRMEPAAAHALAIADNKLGEIADWDPDELGRIVGSGEITGELLGIAGFSEEELSKLLEPVHAPGDFSEVTIDAQTQYTCPKCGYEWRGAPRAASAEG